MRISERTADTVAREYERGAHLSTLAQRFRLTRREVMEIVAAHRSGGEASSRRDDPERHPFDVPTMRDCLCCGQRFGSDGWRQRLCPNCRKGKRLGADWETS